MSNTVVIAIVVAVVAGLVAILAARGSGPRVTTIETRRETGDDGDPAP